IGQESAQPLRREADALRAELWRWARSEAGFDFRGCLVAGDAVHLTNQKFAGGDLGAHRVAHGRKKGEKREQADHAWMSAGRRVSLQAREYVVCFTPLWQRKGWRSGVEETYPVAVRRAAAGVAD